jgi:hypothetical protein
MKILTLILALISLNSISTQTNYIKNHILGLSTAELRDVFVQTFCIFNPMKCRGIGINTIPLESCSLKRDKLLEKIFFFFQESLRERSIQYQTVSEIKNAWERFRGYADLARRQCDIFSLKAFYQTDNLSDQENENYKLEESNFLGDFDEAFIQAHDTDLISVLENSKRKAEKDFEEFTEAIVSINSEEGKLLK